MADFRYFLADYVERGPVGPEPPVAPALVAPSPALCGVRLFGRTGLFWCEPGEALPAGAVNVGRGDVREVPAELFAPAWEARFGFRPAGGTLNAAVASVLTDGADPAGVTGPPPLMPEADLGLRLYFPGHSIVWQERLTERHPHRSKVFARLREDNAALTPAGPLSDRARRVLDWQCEKYGVDRSERPGRSPDWFALLPARLRARGRGPLPHATTVTDDFNRADGPLGAAWSFRGGFAYDLVVASSWMKGTPDTGTGRSAYYSNTTPVSGADQEAEFADVDVTGTPVGEIGVLMVWARVPGSGLYGYYAVCGQDGSYLNRVHLYAVSSGGGTVELGTAWTITPAHVSGDSLKVKCDGSAITAFWNGTAVVGPVTDTTHSGGVLAMNGVYMTHTAGTAPRGDNWRFADLATAPAVSENDCGHRLLCLRR